MGFKCFEFTGYIQSYTNITPPAVTEMNGFSDQPLDLMISFMPNM